MNRQLRVWTPARVLGWVLVIVAAVVAVVHWLAHLGIRPIPWTMGSQDLFLGYPMAALVALLGIIILGRRAARK